MSAQQIKLNINDLVNRIEDEDKLQAFYDALAKIAKDYIKQPKNKAAKLTAEKENKAASNPLMDIEENKETGLQHDLSLVFLANDIFKGTETLSEAGEIAFEKAFKKSLKKEPSLPNRL